MSCAPHRLSAVSGLTRCGVLAMGQRLFKSDARLSGSNYTPITQQTLYAEDGIGSTVLGQYGNRRSTNSAAPAGELDSTEVIYLPTASGPMPIAAQINGRLYAIDSDHLNTPRRLTNQQGQVAWQWLITGFGETAPTQGAQGYAQPDISSVKSYAEAVSFDLRYPGQQWDEETGLSYNLHRYYDAATGRYTQADPIGLDGGWNRFAYVGGDPVNFSDPDGLQARPPRGGGATQPMFPPIGPTIRPSGPYSIPTQGTNPRYYNYTGGSQGRNTDGRGNARDIFREMTGGLATESLPGGNGVWTELPNGTRVNYRETPIGPRIDIYPPRPGSPETLHFPGGPIGGVCLP